MALLKKFWTTFLAIFMLSICTGTTAFASETDKAVGEEAVAEEAGTGEAVAGEAAADEASTTEPVTVIDEGVTDDTVDLLLQEGYYLDEQGQLCYDEPEPKSEEGESEIVEPEDSDAVTVQNDVPAYSDENLRLLSCLVYSEAGNQSYDGMLAVANVVLNRVKSDTYSHVNTIKEVIYDKKWTVQFAVTIQNKKTGLSMMDKALKLYDTRKFTGSNPKAQENAMNKAIKAAKAALGGTNNIGAYLCFQNKRSASRIKKKYSEVKILGDHIFYRTK